MKKVLFISLILIAAMSAALVIPLWYHFTDKTVSPLPDHQTYQEALSKFLPEAVQKKAKAFKCRNFIIPVKSISGSTDLGFPYLVDDVNFALHAYPGWRLCVDESLKKKMIDRADQRFKLWGSMGVGAEMIALSNTQKNVAMKTHYSAMAKCSVIKHSIGDDIRLLLTVNDERQQATLFEIPVTFIHHKTLAVLKARQSAREKKLADLKFRARVSLYVFAGLLTLFFIFQAISVGAWYKRIRRQKTFNTFIAGEIDKREALVNDGHFVAALELADKYLAAFPHDTEIKAFRSRLLDYTNHNPEKAQLAFVEYKKLQNRIKDPMLQDSGTLLSPNERQAITRLLPYHPKLKTAYNQIVLADQKAEQNANARAEMIYGEVMALLKAGEMAEAQKKLASVITAKPDFTKAVELKSRLDKQSGRGLRLIRKEGGGPQLNFFFNDSVSLGRTDVDIMPDIVFDDRRVSRKHLTIDHENGAYTVNDLGSSGGTFVNGDSVKKAPLFQGDLLTISKVIDLSVMRVQTDKGCDALVLTNKNRHFFLVKHGVAFDISGEKVRVPGKGIQLFLCEGVAVLSTDMEALVPENGDEVKAGNDIYEIEVIN